MSFSHLNLIPYFFNRLWLRFQQKEATRFFEQSHQLEATQSQKLFQYLTDNKQTDFGKRYGFSSISSIKQYQQIVPVIESYDELKPDIEKTLNGNLNVLFKGMPLFFETTSGTSAGKKLIPYTPQLKQEFSMAVSPWMANLYSINPAIFNSYSYWSLSPALKSKDKASEFKIGTSSDTDYFDIVSAFFLKQILAVPHNLIQIQNQIEFYIRTWQHLLAHRELTFISVWSPQFLIQLVQFLKDHQDEIIKIDKAININNIGLKSIFPNLRLISCWTHGQSSIWLKSLQSIIEDIPVQGKGLLLTEGVVTIPLGFDQHVLAYQSHFYEFKPDSGPILLAHELEIGQQYEVIITTGGGLYRYNTHDLVSCNGYSDGLPLLVFQGRANQTSDLVGEKLSDVFVSSILKKAIDKFNINNTLHLVPMKTDTQVGYELLMETEADVPSSDLEVFVHHQLGENPYYDQAVKNRQLKPLRARILKQGAIKLLIQHYKQHKGLKDGDAKIPTIFPISVLDNLLKDLTL